MISNFIDIVFIKFLLFLSSLVSFVYNFVNFIDIFFYIFYNLGKDGRVYCMKQQNSSDLKLNDDNRTFKYIIFMAVFFVIGIAIGFTFTKRYLSDKDEKEPVDMQIADNNDITENKEYSDLIESLHSIVKENIAFYNSNGIDISTMENNLKLEYVYNIIKENKLYEETNINALYWNSPTCEYDFLTTVVTNEDGSTYTTGVCDLKRVSKSVLQDNYFKVFNNSVLDVNSEFYPDNKTKCIVEEASYLCGEINSTDGVISGALTPKFTIQKVTKEEDMIVISEKGYLEDTRNTIVNPEDGIDHYYLHSSDSKDYYYELKSADNLTFEHYFKMDSTGNYYYIKTEVKK